MPCLDRTELEGDHAQLYVFSVMLQPRNAAAQASIFKVFKNRADIRFYKKMQPLKDMYSEKLKAKIENILFDAADPDGPTIDSIQPYFAQGLDRGRHAGRMLNWTLENRASLNKAIEEFAGHKLESRTQRTIWRTMMPAAHLWATSLQHPIPPDDRLTDWLSIAEEIRRQGETFIPHRGHDPLLDPTQTWRLP
jgi:hypothetical protein